MFITLSELSDIEEIEEINTRLDEHVELVNMSDLIGEYVLKQDTRFSVGVLSFLLSAGAKVHVSQIDEEFKKVLMHFSTRDCDWVHVNKLILFDRVK